MDPTNYDDHQAKNQRREAEKASSKQAADLIRQKLESLYNEEPSAKQEENEVSTVANRSPHQQFMYQLSTSGKSLAEIQTAWHQYYQGLKDSEKHEVWNEFYAANQHLRPAASNQNKHSKPSTVTQDKETLRPAETPKKINQHLSSADVKQRISRRIIKRKKLSARQHFQSLAFGLGLGSFVVLILLFGFFNERFIAPFITPSRHVSSTPIIIDPNSIAVSANPEVIIPKINVEIPVIYTVQSISDEAIQTALQNGVVHYATTPTPGQQGNVVIFGHSSNNIFNPGRYKFAFVLLSKLNNGDTFYLTKDKKLYVYKVYKKQVVQPNDVSVLGPSDKPDTASLITCDPPGTSLHRLIVTGEQISPSPTTNIASTAIKTSTTPDIIPSNAPSLWQRVKDWFTQ